MIIGISFDSPADNKVFAEDNGFPFRLLSDRDGTIGRAYGVTRDPGDRYAGYPYRATFVIDPEGVVRLSYAVAPTQIAGHPERVLGDLRALIAS